MDLTGIAMHGNCFAEQDRTSRAKRGFSTITSTTIRKDHVDRRFYRWKAWRRGDNGIADNPRGDNCAVAKDRQLPRKHIPSPMKTDRQIGVDSSEFIQQAQTCE